MEGKFNLGVSSFITRDDARRCSGLAELSTSGWANAVASGSSPNSADARIQDLHQELMPRPFRFWESRGSTFVQECWGVCREQRLTRPLGGAPPMKNVIAIVIAREFMRKPKRVGLTLKVHSRTE